MHDGHCLLQLALNKYAHTHTHIHKNKMSMRKRITCSIAMQPTHAQKKTH